MCTECKQEYVTVLCNQSAHADTHVTENRPHIIIKNKQEKTCTLIDVAIPENRNVRKEVENKLKLRSLCTAIERKCNMKCKITPVITGATGIVTRSLRKNLEARPGEYPPDSLQKTATSILGTSHVIRKVLQCETGSLSAADHRWFKRSTRKKRAVTRYNNNNNNNNNNVIIIIIIIIINVVFCVCSILIWFAGTIHVFFTVNKVGLHRGRLKAPATLPPA